MLHIKFRMKVITATALTLLLAVSTQADGPSRGYSTTQTFGGASEVDPESASFYQVTPPPHKTLHNEPRRNHANEVRDQRALSTATTKTITPARKPVVKPEVTAFVKPTTDQRKVFAPSERQEKEIVLKSRVADSPFERTFFETSERDPLFNQVRSTDRGVLQKSAVAKTRRNRTIADWP